MRLQNQLRELRRVGDVELLAEEDRRVAAVHVREQRADERLAVADGQRAGQPRRIIERGLPPIRDGVGGRVGALHIFPRGRGREQRRVLHRRPARAAARHAPASGEIVVQRGMDQLNGLAAAYDERVADRGPRKAERVIHLVLNLVGRVAQRDFFPTARQAGAAVGVERPERAAHAELRLEKRRVLRHDHVAARRDIGGGERVVNSVREKPSAQIHCARPGVMQLDELRRLRFHVRVVMDLVDDDGG